MSQDLHQNKVSPRLQATILPSARALVSFPHSSPFLGYVTVKGCDSRKAAIVVALQLQPCSAQ